MATARPASSGTHRPPCGLIAAGGERARRRDCATAPLRGGGAGRASGSRREGRRGGGGGGWAEADDRARPERQQGVGGSAAATIAVCARLRERGERAGSAGCIAGNCRAARLLLGRSGPRDARAEGHIATRPAAFGSSRVGDEAQRAGGTSSLLIGRPAAGGAERRAPIGRPPACLSSPARLCPPPRFSVCENFVLYPRPLAVTWGYRPGYASLPMGASTNRRPGVSGRWARDPGAAGRTAAAPATAHRPARPA